MLKKKFSDKYFPISITTACGDYMAAENSSQKIGMHTPLNRHIGELTNTF